MAARRERRAAAARGACPCSPAAWSNRARGRDAIRTRPREQDRGTKRRMEGRAPRKRGGRRGERGCSSASAPALIRSPPPRQDTRDPQARRPPRQEHWSAAAMSCDGAQRSKTHPGTCGRTRTWKSRRCGRFCRSLWKSCQTAGRRARRARWWRPAPSRGRPRRRRRPPPAGSRAAGPSRRGEREREGGLSVLLCSCGCVRARRVVSAVWLYPRGALPLLW
jgi:hypothetical protein